MLSPEQLRPFKLRIEDYELLDRTGAFDEGGTELIEGMIVAVSPEMRPHTRVKNQLMLRFEGAIAATDRLLEALVEPTLSLPPHNMPQPDVLIARTDARDVYFGLQDAALVVEVGASSLRSDLGVKKLMYAEQGVPELWVVDVAGRHVHQFWSPAGGDYAETRVVPLAGELRSATMPDLAIDGSGIL